MRLLHTLKQHTELSLCSFFMVLLGVLGAILVLHFAERQQEQQLQRYGQALAERAASQAIEPALAQDMISLQVIVQSLTQQPAIVRASVRDVENRLLVTSGEPNRAHTEPTLSYNASISLDTHLAGHLSVTLQAPAPSQLHRVFLWLWCAAIGLCIAALWLSHYILQQRRNGPTVAHEGAHSARDGIDSAPLEHEPQDAPERAPNEEDEQEPSSEPHAHAAAPQSVTVELVFLNLDTLQQQLSLSRFNSRLQQLEQTLTGILALYAGSKQPLEQQRMRITVSADNRADASFYALCICQLALRLSLHGERPSLKVAANVIAHSEQGTPLTHPEQHPPQHVTPGVWVDPALQCGQLEQHVLISPSNHLVQIKPSYQALLKRQEQQLISLTASAGSVTNPT